MKIVLSLLLFTLLSVQVFSQQSTTGEIPKSNVDVIGHISSNQKDIQAQYVISGVPAYNWRYGCGPTALGMIIGYYDEHSYPDLFIGSSVTQTPAVQQLIASNDHYNDYSLPLDYYPNLISDLSEDPPGDEHSDNCIADFMLTSRSIEGNYYGWSWSSHIAGAYTDYLASVSSYSGQCQLYYFSFFTFSDYMQEIDANRPMMALVDTDGDGFTDHFITLLAYKQEAGIDYYGCYQTWDTNLHWYEFEQIASGQQWGISILYTFQMNFTAIESDQLYTFELYPNPVDENIQICFLDANMTTCQISIYNASGQIVFDASYENSKDIQIDVSSFEPALYFVQISSQNKLFTQKIIIY